MTMSHETICILDDDPTLCDMVRILLETRDYRVLAATDGLEGLETIRDSRPDLVLLDVKMPGLNGYEILNRMRATPTIAHTPVIVITSLTNGSKTTDVEWKSRMGVADFVSKPFEPLELVERIQAVLHPPVPKV